MARKTSPLKTVETITHEEARRTNIPTAEYQSVMRQEELAPVRLSLQKRDPDLDPQLVWRGKYDGDDTLTVQAPPLYIQEKIHPKSLIQDLMRQTQSGRPRPQQQMSLFADFNGIAPDADKTDFYQHDQNWTNRMILGDSLQVMASLSEREGLRGKVQCIYMDPPYGIKFNSNFQWSTTSRDVKDGKADNMTREPEQVRAFRDTWKDGIHSYLSYLRDRLILARDLLTDSGSIFVQIGDENVHRVRMLMDEIFGEDNYISLLSFKKTSSLTSDFISNNYDYIVWYSKNKVIAKYKNILIKKGYESELGFYSYIEKLDGTRRKINEGESVSPNLLFSVGDLTSSHDYSEGKTDFYFRGKCYSPRLRFWTTSPSGMARLAKSVFGNFSFYSYKKACGQKRTVRGSKNSRRLSNDTPAI